MIDKIDKKMIVFYAIILGTLIALKFSEMYFGWQ